MPYRPPSQRSSSRPSTGAIIFCCILGVIIAFIGFVIYASRQPEPAPAKAEVIKKPEAKKGLDANELRRENNQRQQDARAVTYGGGDFYRANLSYPTAYASGMFTGPAGTKPQPTTLVHYKAVLVADGAQKPMVADEIRFVANAVCAPILSATAASSQPYAYVVQYAIKNADGSFSPQCLKL